MIDEKKLIEDLHKWDMQDLYLPIHFEMLINEQPKVNPWIPISERLPDKDGKYLVQHDFGGIGCLDYADGWNCYRHPITKKVLRSFEISSVVSWMPLPKAYEGEQK